MSATALGTGRLLIWERFAVGMGLAWSEGLGYWNERARFQAFTGGDADHLFRSRLWAIVRLGRKTSLDASGSFLVPGIAVDGESEWGAGMGDTRLGLRQEITSIGEYLKIPAIALTFGVQAPTGRPAERSQSTLGADVTTRGAWVLSAGTSVEWTKLPWFWRLNVGTTVAMPTWREDRGQWQRLGPTLQTSFVSGRELVRDLVLSGYLRFMYEGAIHRGNEKIASSSARETALGAALSWRLAPHWTVQTNVEVPLAFDRMGDNKIAAVVGGMGVRYGYF